MWTPFVLAAIPGLLALVTAIWVWINQRGLVREARRWEEQVRADDRARSEQELLDKYREPLIISASDLSSRIRNIQTQSFLSVYLDERDAHRSDVALRGTLYRFARYWAIAEGLKDRVGVHRFEASGSTTSLAKTMAEIGATFATDRGEVGGTAAMVWREEQRAVAELMTVGDADLVVIGFSTFFDEYPAKFEPWLSGLAADLRPPDIVSSRRLAAIADLLDEMVQELRAGRSATVGSVA